MRSGANEQYNEFCTKAAKASIKSEHCLGLLKNQFPILRNIPVLVNGKNSMRQIVREFTACAVMHNMLIDEPNIPLSWYDEQKELNNEEANALEVDDHEPGGARWERLLAHIMHVFGRA